MLPKPKILFLCTGNSCRSQMAEAWTRYLMSDLFDPYSAGIEIRDIDSRAIRVMAEVSIDISGQRSKNVETLKDIEFDYVITVCDHAREACPFFPAKKRILHRGFPDPPRLAETAGSQDEALVHYREVRDQIRTFVEGFPGTLDEVTRDLRG